MSRRLDAAGSACLVWTTVGASFETRELELIRELVGIRSGVQRGLRHSLSLASVPPTLGAPAESL
jgi:hypothetical protein